MNDRFKFRVWNKTTKKYIYEIKDYSIMLSLDGDIHAIARPYTHKKDIFNYNWDGSLILEQCTGLKDKNGKLIYEGDIVRKDLKQDFEGDSTTPSYYCDCSCIGIVAFNASTGYFMKNAKVFLTLNKNEPKKLQDKILKRTRLYAKRCTVIGNIHENPELLKE